MQNHGMNRRRGVTVVEVVSRLPRLGYAYRSSCLFTMVCSSSFEFGLTHKPDMVTAVGPPHDDATSVSY